MLPTGSCREIKRRVRGAEDGEFPIMFSPHCAPVKLYCHGMDTERPAEYLTLPSGSDNNYASFHKERLKNFHNCDGPTDPSPTLTARYWGTTKYVFIYIWITNLYRQWFFICLMHSGKQAKTLWKTVSLIVTMGALLMAFTATLELIRLFCLSKVSLDPVSSCIDKGWITVSRGLLAYYQLGGPCPPPPPQRHFKH